MSFSPTNIFPLPIIALFAILLALHGMAQPKFGGNRFFGEYLQQFDKRSPLKKSDGLSDFVGSLNGAARLRYGKRSDGPPPEEVEDILSKYYPTILLPFNGMGRWQMTKRRPNYAEALPVGLLDRLNGAERLRFGRK